MSVAVHAHNAMKMTVEMYGHLLVEQEQRHALEVAQLKAKVNDLEAQLARKLHEWESLSRDGRSQVDRLVEENGRLRTEVAKLRETHVNHETA